MLDDDTGDDPPTFDLSRDASETTETALVTAESAHPPPPDWASEMDYQFVEQRVAAGGIYIFSYYALVIHEADNEHTGIASDISFSLEEMR